jgi:putative ABC transport system permease protein
MLFAGFKGDHMFYFLVGFRNIIKNFRRSLITMTSIIIGMVACLLTCGFFNWNINVLKESMIHSGIGHYQLYPAGFSKFGDDEPYQYLIPDAAPIIKDLQRITQVQLVTTRMAFSGILSSGDKSTVVVGEAGYPDNERKFKFDSQLIQGTYLSSDKSNGCILGDGAVKKLSVKIGDTLTLMGNMKDGGINAVDLKLIGITQSGYSNLDNISVTTSLSVIQNLLNIDHNVQKIVVLLKNTEDTPKILPQIRKICQRYNLEYKDWESLAEFYHSLKLMYDVVFYIIIFIVLAIVTFTISNTVNMNLNDRFQEIGTIRALGTKRTQVALIFIVESLLLGLIGGLIGLIISYLFIGLTELIGGLPVVIHAGQQHVWMHIFFHPSVTAIIICIVLFSLVAIIASLIPSQRASKISIIEALRWI